MQISLAYGEVPERDYRIGVVLFNETEYAAAESKFSTVIQKGDLSVPEAAAYVINSYYGRASCRIEQGRKLKENKKPDEALVKYEQAYQDLSVFKGKFEELQDTIRSHTLYDEMEKHFVTISGQMVQLAGEAGDICSKQGKHEKAIEWYDKGLLYIDSRMPSYGDILYAKADAVFQLEEYEETLRLLARFEEELSYHSKASNALLFAGDIHNMMAEMLTDRDDARRHLEKALDVYRQVVAANPEGADVEMVKTALLEKARCEKKLGRMEESIADFKKIQIFYPGSPYEVEAALEIGDYSFLAKQYNDALENFSRAAKVGKSLDLHDLVAISYYWAGWSYFKQADAETSPDMRRRNKKLYEDSIDAFQDSIKYSEKHWEKEGREVKRAKDLESYHGESLFMIGRSYQRLEKWNDAIKTFGKIPRVSKTWWLRGLAEVALSTERNGDVNGSLAKWDELKREIALAKVPDIELNLLMRRADSIFDLQRFPEAEKAYREIVVKYPGSEDEPRARINLGLSLFKQDKNSDAIHEFSMMLSKYGRDESMGPLIGEALFWKGYLTARLEGDLSNNLRQAMRDYKELVNRFPDDPRADDAQFEIGFSTYSLGGSDEGKYSEAIVEYSKILENYPESEYADDALFEIARCYQLLENESKEEESLRQMVLGYPTSEMADNALLRVAELHFDRAQKDESSQERQVAESAYNEIIANYPGTESEAIAHFQIASIIYRFDGSFYIAAMEFEKCASVTEGLLEKVINGEYVPSDLDVATIANLLLRSTFWQAESMFQSARDSEEQAQPSESVKQAYGLARGVYKQLLDRRTRLGNDFPETVESLRNIMAGERLDIPIIGETRYMVSWCLYKEGDPGGAKADLQFIKSPENLKLKADYLLASITYDEGKLVNAKAMAENWLSSEVAKDMPDEYNVGIQVLLAKIALASGSISEAKAQALDTWALFQSIDGLWEESAYIVAKCYQKQSDIEKARSWFEKLQGSSIELWKMKGRDAILQLGN